MVTILQSFQDGDGWVKISESGKPHLLNQLYNRNPFSNFKVDLKETQSVENVFVRKNNEKTTGKSKKGKSKKIKKKKRTQKYSQVTALVPTIVCGDRQGGEVALRKPFTPYTTGGFRETGVYHTSPGYLNGTIASEMKRVDRDYWPCRWVMPSPFVVGTSTTTTHNVLLLKQETCAKFRTASLPFTDDELRDQSINSLRSIKRSVEKHWKL